MGATEKKTDGVVLVCPACYTLNIVMKPEEGSVCPPEGTVYVCVACGKGRMEYDGDTACDPFEGEEPEDIIQKKIDENDLNTPAAPTIEEIEQMIDKKLKGAT